jgi:hypothetical protein
MARTLTIKPSRARDLHVNTVVPEESLCLHLQVSRRQIIIIIIIIIIYNFISVCSDFKFYFT